MKTTTKIFENETSTNGLFSITGHFDIGVIESPFGKLNYTFKTFDHGIQSELSFIQDGEYIPRSEQGYQKTNYGLNETITPTGTPWKDQLLQHFIIEILPYWNIPNLELQNHLQPPHDRIH